MKMVVIEVVMAGHETERSPSLWDVVYLRPRIENSICRAVE